MTSKLKEGVMQGVFTLCACVSILAVALICIFLFANGVPTLFKIGPLKFLLGTTWKHLRHGGGYPRRRAHRPADGHLHVQVRVAPHQ